MNEWTVVLALGTLAGLFFTIGKPIIDLNKNLTTLNINVKVMSAEIQEQKADLKQQKSDAHDSHQALWAETSRIDAKVQDHETRLSIIENTK